MKRISWELKRLVTQSWASISLLMAGIGIAAMLQLILIGSAEQKLETARQTLEQHKKMAGSIRSSQAKVITLQDVYARFPSQKDVPKWLSLIFTSARDMNVDLEIGQYSYNKEQGTPLSRYQIELPVTAPYPTVKALVATLMNQMPFAALDDLALTKEHPEDQEVNATLRLSIYVLGDPK